MFLRAVFAAVVFCAALSPGVAASSSIDIKDAYSVTLSLKTLVEGLPDNTAKQQVSILIQSIALKASKLPAAKREAFVSQRVPELTSVAERLTPQTVPKTVLKQIQNSMAYLNNRTNRWEEGRRLSDKVLSYAPQDTDALVNRAHSLYSLKDFKSAFEDADKAARLDPNDGDAYAARALASWGMGEYLKTLEDARRALAINPNDRTAYALMRLAEGRIPPLTIRGETSRLEIEIQREYHGMVSQITQVESKSRETPSFPAPRPVERLVRRAASRIALKDYYGAIEDANKVLSADPANTTAYYYRAAAHNLLGRYEEAAADATQALSLNPAEAEARDARAFAYNHQGRYRDAVADANHSLEINPQNPYAFINRGFAHEKMGDVETMLRDFKTASEINPQFEPVYHDAAAAYGVEPAFSSLKTAGAPAPRPTLKQRQFLIVLASSIMGGLLIALGFVHLFGGRLTLRRAASAARRTPPAIADGYTIIRTLGRGGMGVVYEAVDKTLGRKVAIKMLCDDFELDAKAKEHLLNEARTVAALHHPHIVDIHSIVTDVGGLALVFEFIAGQTVDEIIAQKKRLALGEAKAILKPVCSALQFAHDRRVVHRDLKPSIIMITNQGVVKVMDFGISRRVQDGLPAAMDGRRGWALTASVVGTPDYMAPEQEEGLVRPESDIFSLGACLYEMVTGTRPFPVPASRVQKIIGDYALPSSLEPSLPRSLDVLVAGALHPDPDKRIHSASDFWALLEAVS